MNQSTLSSDQPLKVLTPTLRDRLQAATYATRVLAASHYRVSYQDLRLQSDRRPVLTVANHDERLRAELQHIKIERHGKGRAVIGQFLDVDLCLPQH